MPHSLSLRMKPFLFAVTVTCTLSSVPLAALECFPVPLKSSVAASDIVLFGIVESVRYADDQQNGAATHYVATVRVVELWKGSTPKVIELHQAFVAGGMDLYREDLHRVGATYLFFARRLTTTHPLSHPYAVVTSGYTAAECISKQVPDRSDLHKELGPGYPPQP